MLPVRAFVRLGRPLRDILTDYVEVAKDLVQGAKQRPVKAALYLTSAALFTATWRKRPDYASYVDGVVNYANELGMCSETVRKPSAKRYLDDLSKLHADGRLKYVNLGVVAVVLKRDYSPSCANYHETCQHLQSRWWTMRERVVDVGFWDRWRNLELEMIDFDVNEEELDQLT